MLNRYYSNVIWVYIKSIVYFQIIDNPDNLLILFFLIGLMSARDPWKHQTWNLELY